MRPRLGRGVIPAKALYIALAGVAWSSSAISIVTGSALIRLWGCGVGAFMRGRVVELMTERRKDLRRVWGVTGSESTSMSSWVYSSCGGGGMLNRARGRGAMAGVGVNAVDGAGEEYAVDGAIGERTGWIVWSNG